MQVHASCAARDGHGVLLIGASGSGKSDLLLRLLDHGFQLVADDRVEIVEGVASPAAGLAGLLEVRGLGILRLPFEPCAALKLGVELGQGPRLPHPAQHAILAVPIVRIDPWLASAPARVVAALRCATGQLLQVAGAFA